MAGLRVEGNTSGNVAEVDANNNLMVVLPVITDQAGYVQLSGHQSLAAEPAGLVTEALRISSQGRMTVGQPVMLMNELFNNTTLNSAIFTAPVTTQTVTCAGGTLNLNASAITTLSTVSRVATYMMFPFQADFATYMTWDMLLTQAPQVNAVIEAGFIICTASTAPTDGAFFRYDAAGNLKAVLNTNGTEVTSSALTAPSANVMHKYKIIVENDRVLFYIDGACQAIIATPTGVGYPLYAAAQPATFRTYNAASAPSLANTVKVGYLFVGLQDAAGFGKDVATVNALQGHMGSQGQTGHTMGSTALFTNSLAPGAGVAMTNTTAALGSGLGGQFATQPTLTASTDGVVSSYQVPAATAAIPGKTLYIKGVKVQSMVTTALTGGPCLWVYSLAYGHTAVSLATAEASTTKAPRRVPLGMESIAATAAVGVLGSVNGISQQFLAPIAVNPGEFVQVVAKNVGTVTSAGVVLFLVTFDAYWE